MHVKFWCAIQWFSFAIAIAIAFVHCYHSAPLFSFDFFFSFFGRTFFCVAQRHPNEKHFENWCVHGAHQTHWSETKSERVGKRRKKVSEQLCLGGRDNIDVYKLSRYFLDRLFGSSPIIIIMTMHTPAQTRVSICMNCVKPFIFGFFLLNFFLPSFQSWIKFWKPFQCGGVLVYRMWVYFGIEWNEMQYFLPQESSTTCFV